MRLLIASSEPMAKRGLAAVLEHYPTIVLTTCDTSEEALALGQTVDVLLLDTTSDVNLATLGNFKVHLNLKVILWAKEIRLEFAYQAMTVGVKGILRKHLPIPIQVKCIESVYAGDLWFEQSLMDKFLTTNKVSLTGREIELVCLLAQGLKNKEIAYEMKVSPLTCKVYTSRILAKTGAKDRYELALFALRNLSDGSGNPLPRGSLPKGMRSLMMKVASGPFLLLLIFIFLKVPILE